MLYINTGHYIKLELPNWLVNEESDVNAVQLKVHFCEIYAN